MYNKVLITIAVLCTIISICTAIDVKESLLNVVSAYQIEMS